MNSQKSSFTMVYMNSWTYTMQYKEVKKTVQALGSNEFSMRTTHRCVEMGTWILLVVHLLSSTAFSENIECEKPSPPENGEIFFTDNSESVGSQIEYICDEHHILEPITSQFAICTVYGIWSSPKPRCIKMCKVGDLSHGSIRTISGFLRTITEGSYVHDNTTLFFTCNDGYERYVSDYETLGTLKCVNGTLRPGSPECRPKRCFIAPTTNMEYFIEQEKVLENYIHGGIVMNARCSNKTELFRSSSYLERDQVNVMCYLGTLKPESLVCKDKRCDIIETIDNGQFINRGIAVGKGEKIISDSKIQMTCSKGYELYNKTNSTYLRLEQIDIKCYQGSFTSEIPSCEPKRCNITQIENGKLVNGASEIDPRGVIGSNITITLLCSDGFELYNESISMYLGSDKTDILCYQGSFNVAFPKCKPKRCFIAPTTNIEYFIGQEKVLGNYIHGGIVMNARCSNKTELFRSSSYLERDLVNVTCYLGTLKPESLVCKDKRCNIIETIDNGQFINRGIAVGKGEKIISDSKIQMTCSKGYELYNKTNSTYLRLEQIDIKCYQGSFTSEIPSCEPKRCNIMQIENGKLVNGSSEIDPRGMIGSNISITLICSDGFELYNESISMYLGSDKTDILCYQGSFNVAFPKCNPKRCKQPVLTEAVTGFVVIGNKSRPDKYFPHGQSLEAVCKDGYRQQGHFTCQKGIWTGNSTCEPEMNPPCCKTLNPILVKTGVITKSGAFFGTGSGPIWLDDLNCTGLENNLNRCGHRGWGNSDCSHREDASVICPCEFFLCI
ncbi:hypothetical protein ACJMK2_038605 [Sinanodonta woodiana]|uniref:Uncharacterized protein n=1 Tax=Sinanodonta woodiana TaxID=1069815 RepID=A0ABD3W9I4_SINWO